MQGMDLNAIANANMTDRARDAAALVPEQALHDIRREARRRRIRRAPFHPIHSLVQRLRELIGGRKRSARA